MFKSVEGIYRQGRIELSESPPEVADDTPVIVTFLESPGVDLRTRGIDVRAAADLRGALAAFTEDWDNPDMAVYDDYDAARRGA